MIASRTFKAAAMAATVDFITQLGLGSLSMSKVPFQIKTTLTLLPKALARLRLSQESRSHRISLRFQIALQPCSKLLLIDHSLSPLRLKIPHSEAIPAVLSSLAALPTLTTP